MAADRRAEFFDGKVDQQEYSQIVLLETGWTEGLIPVFYRNLVTSSTTQSVFSFTGMSYEDAHRGGSVSVSDIGGVQYTVPFEGSITDKSSGSRAFVTDEVKVSRRRISYHLWNVTVTVAHTDYFVNGSPLPL